VGGKGGKIKRGAGGISKVREGPGIGGGGGGLSL
jgi:hypothetical protein